MTSYRYRALNEEGQLCTGQLDAIDEQSLRLALQKGGLELIHARPFRKFIHLTLRYPTFFTRAKSQRNLALLCPSIAALLRAGVSLTDTLKLAAETTKDAALRKAFKNSHKRLLKGENLARAFGHEPELFNNIFLAILATGEKTGDLAHTFDLLAELTTRQELVRQKMRRALRYPLFLLLLAMGVTTFMLTIVMPPLTNFLEASGAPLPFVTRILLAIGTALTTGFLWLPPLLLLCMAGVIWFARRSPALALRLDRFILSLPFIGTIQHKAALSRLSTGFTSLLSAGLTVPNAWALALPSLGHPVLEARGQIAHRDMTRGLSFSNAARPIFGDNWSPLLCLAENSGNLTRSLITIADQSERETHEAVDAFLGALEPALTLMVGGLLAWIVLAVLGPLYGSLEPLAQGL